MCSKNKKLLIIWTSIAIIILLLISIIISTIVILSNDGDSKPEDITIEKYEQETYNDGILNEANQKANNTDNFSFFYLERKGAFIATQIISDIMVQKQLNSEREVYVGFNDSTTPNGDISGWDNWPSKINWEELYIDGEYHQLGVNEKTFEFTEEDLDAIFNMAFKDGENGKVDLYFDSYTYKVSEHKMYKSFVKNIGKYWNRINSITFFTDGTAIYPMEDEYLNTLDKYNTNDLDKANNQLNSLISGTLTTNDLSDKDMETISILLPILTPGGDDDFIQMFSPTYTVYESNARDNVFQSSGAGFKSVMDNATEDWINNMKRAIGLDEYELTDNYINQEGKTNFVFSGNLVNTTEGATNDAEAIVDIYNEYESSFEPGTVNLLYKPHPRSTQEFIDEMISNVSTITSTDATTWIQVIPKDIPFEFFAMGNEFLDNPETNTDYQLFLTGTSTVVPALYECGITSDNVEYYIVNSEADINTLHSWYGDSGIIDYDKVIIA